MSESPCAITILGSYGPYMFFDRRASCHPSTTPPAGAISEMTPDGTSVISSPVIVYDGNDGVNHTIEGPKLYRRGDYYYILAPAGGVVDGWQLALLALFYKDGFRPFSFGVGGLDHVYAEIGVAPGYIVLTPTP